MVTIPIAETHKPMKKTAATARLREEALSSFSRPAAMAMSPLLRVRW
jgi:hypothetical protein